MSRLDSAIRRLEAQRACLDRAAGLVSDLVGPFLELGLGNGRTYDHLRSLAPGRRIVVFERKAMAHPDSMPPARDLVEGDFRETLKDALKIAGAPAALIHADIGSGDSAQTGALAAWLGPVLAPLTAPGGLIVSDQPIVVPGARPFPLPETVAEGRYHMQKMPF